MASMAPEPPKFIDTSDNASASVALLKEKNVVAVGRYYSSRAWKRLTASEAKVLSAAGIDLFTVFEDNGDPALTVDKGVSDAQIAVQQARAVGQPEGSAIYFALEHLPSGYDASHVPGIKLYIEGVRKVLGTAYRLGVYSNGTTLAALLDDKLCDLAWLSASRGFAGSKAFYESKRWVLAQDPKVDQQWGSLSVDLNETQGDFGAFRVSLPAVPFKVELRVGDPKFSGEPTTLWLTRAGADRKMRLLDDFWFRDKRGREWRASAGTVVDGASIPRPLWSTVGSPYTGDYRRASIVHDVACVEAEGDSGKRRAADRMFYEACREGGCSPFEAAILYVGVRVGALADRVPVWRRAMDDAERPKIRQTVAQRRLEVDFELAAEIVTDGPVEDDPEAVEARTDAALSAVSALDLAGL